MTIAQQEKVSVPTIEKVRCAKCGLVNTSEQDRCIRCKAWLYVDCRHCGHTNYRNISRCSECGKRLHGSVWRLRYLLQNLPRLNVFNPMFTIAILVIIVLSVLLIWMSR
jgi:hypothetical protein